ncbi:hypothetical protein BT96DRAFT_1023204 [Gymnopus androsaceus JB14]|uniref:Uncharacterized protein n=1 Tax=Gymnopus androsaceus JB14 TaxID=1447944 RepID=A0A6A4H6T7_9AGAR|nr:hypothetical protein BT96DRAFT_1023204 [Gymnopus androsaceus JB14]
MTRTHFPVNQHAIHHIHARFMSNLVVGPGGQATLVAPTQPESTIAVVSSASSFSSVIYTQQAPSSLPTAITSSPNSPIEAATSSPAPTIFVPTEISTTVVVTSEVFESSSTIPSSPTTLSSSSDSSLASSTTTLVSSSTAPSTTTLTSDSQTAPVSTPASLSSSSSSTPIPTRTTLPASSTDVATSEPATKEPTFYIGVVLATIIVIACLAALVAWWFRIRNHSRRHKKTVAVPWASRRESSLSPFTDPDSLEKGESLSPHDDPHQRTWEPRGDRDSGEPKRTKSYLENLSSPTKRRPGPILGLHSPPPVVYPFHAHHPPSHPASYPSSLASIPSVPLGPLPESIAYPLPSSSRPLPPQPGYLQFNPNLHPNPPSVRMQFLTDPEFGTPRLSMMKPRYLSLHEQGLGVPWNFEAPASALESCEEIPSIPLSVSSENIPGSPMSLSQKLAPMQEVAFEKPRVQSTPSSASAPQAQNGTWSSSIKANLVYAYNAVAKVAGGASANDEYEDKLTPLPSRNSSRNRKKESQGGARTSVQETGWVEYFGGELVGKAPSEVELEETSEGKGIVHIHPSISEDGCLPFPGCGGSSSTGLGMGLQGYGGNDHAFSSRSSVYSNISPSRKSSVMSTEALVVKKKNPSVKSRGSIRSNTSGNVDAERNSGSQRRPKYAYGGGTTSRKVV